MATVAQVTSDVRTLNRLARLQATNGQGELAAATFAQAQQIAHANGLDAYFSDDFQQTQAVLSGDPAAVSAQAQNDALVKTGQDNQPGFFSKIIGDAPRADVLDVLTYGLASKLGVGVGLTIEDALNKTAADMRALGLYRQPPQSGKEAATPPHAVVDFMGKIPWWGWLVAGGALVASRRR